MSASRSTWFSRWNAAAAARRGPGGATCAAVLPSGPTNRSWSPRASTRRAGFSLGRYAGPRREAIVAVKERGRADLIAPLAAALAPALHQLLTWGIVDAPLDVVPAPTRRSAARRRGGDPVTRMALAARRAPGLTVVAALRMRAFTRDSVGLSAAAGNATSPAGSGCGEPASRATCCWSTTSSPPAPPPPNRCGSCKQRVRVSRRSGGRARLTRDRTTPAITARSNRHEELKTGLRN